MPFVLIMAGVVLLVASVRNTQQQLFYLLASDFTGPHNFIFWLISILIIGAVGYIPKAKPLSDGFLILVILVLFLKKGTGFVDMFQKQISSTQNATPHVSTGGTGGQSVVSVGGGSGVGLTIGGGSGGGITIGGGRGGLGTSGNGCDFFDPFCRASIGGTGVFGPGSGDFGFPGFFAN